MTIIANPESELPGKLRGLHLFGYSGAPCAQRVRFALGEKGFKRSRDIAWDSSSENTLQPADQLSYISRAVSLPRKQHLSAAYAAIHPHMVVPALVHNGVLHIESLDIIRYLDQTWPANPIIPPEEDAKALCDHYVERAAALHRSVRYMSFKWSFGGLAKLNDEQLQLLRKLELNGSPEQLVAFYDDFCQDKISLELYQHHLGLLENAYADLERLFSKENQRWISGENFSMADIVWTIKTLRIRDCGYPFARNFPAVQQWFQRATARRGFVEGVWRDARLMSGVFRLKAALADFFHQGIREMSTQQKSAIQAD